MTTRPEGTHGISLDQLKTMLAGSRTFQEATGGSARAAKSHVHLGRQIGSPPRPFVQLELQNATGEAINNGSRNILLASGTLKVHFERDTDLTAADPYVDAVDWFSRVVDEVNCQAGDEDVGNQFGLTHLPLLTVDLNSIGQNSRHTWHSLGRFYSADVIWTWGDE